MRLIDVFQRPDYQPMDRGDAFPQYYEDGDRAKWHHPFEWHYYFWQHLQWDSINGSDDALEMLLMGGEL